MTFSSIIAREELLDHARSSPHRAAMDNASATREEYNPLCGDRVKVYVKMNEKRVITSMTFEGSGCVISQAASSLVAEHIQGKQVDEIEKLGRQDIEMLVGGPLSPARVKCGMLPLVALKRALGIS
jgi:nitrogen fixation protein NifU and related proteins